MKNVIYSLDEAYSVGIDHCGGKGWGLARLNYFGFNVPGSYILNSDVYTDLIKGLNISDLISQVKCIDDRQLHNDNTKKILDTITAKIINTKLNSEVKKTIKITLDDNNLLDTPLAIRSSATLEDGHKSSFAGIHKSYLNIKGIENIETSILKCFASLWSLSAVSYRKRMKIKDDELSCAVVFMKLIDAKSSGVNFSCNPTNGRKDVTLINTNFGLGESVVNGDIEPDAYQINSNSLDVESIQIGGKAKKIILKSAGKTELDDSLNSSQVLSIKQIQQLTKITQCIYWAFGGIHQDIEWAYDGKEFFILQARPVTIINSFKLNGFESQQEIFSNGNFKDSAPMVQNTLWQSVFSYLTNSILKAPFDLIGYKMPDGLSLVRLYNGRAYLNISLLQWVYLDSTGYKPSDTNKTIGGHQREIEIDKTLNGGIGKRLLRVWHVIKLMNLMNKYKKQALRSEQKEMEFVKSIFKFELNKLTLKDLLAKLHLCNHEVCSYIPTFAVLSSTSGSIIALSDLLEKYFPNKGMLMANKLLFGASNITSANHGYELQELGQIVKHDTEALSFFNNKNFTPDRWKNLSNISPFKIAFEKFLDKYGHRAVFELDMSNPRWREDSSYLLKIIKKNINTDFTKTRQANDNQALMVEIKKVVPFYLHGMVRLMVKKSIEGAEFREMGKSTLIRLLEPSRWLLLEIGERFTELDLLEDKQDIFHCALVEIVSILDGTLTSYNLKELVKMRKLEKKRLEEKSAPDIIKNNKPIFSKPIASNSINKIKGMGVSSGTVKGVARVVYNPNKGVNLKQGEILVAPSTDPAWTPLFLNVSAIVMETGGQLSHGAIVAREYGIPAVVNVQGLFSIINDGDVIVVNGDRGEVEKINTELK